MKKLGRIYIPSDDMETPRVAKIFKLLELVPVRVELLLHGHMFEIIGISPWFDAKPDCEYAPENEVSVTDDILTVEKKS